MQLHGPPNFGPQWPTCQPLAFWTAESVLRACSQVQQHSFNCPYQAGSPRLHPNSNTANDAEVYELDLQEGDLVVMATDGVFDNLWDRDLEKILGSCYAVSGSPSLPGLGGSA